MNHQQLNPENSYLHIALQIGLVGLIVYLLWLGMQWYESYQLPKQERRLIQGLIIGFAIANFCVTALSINMSSIIYLLMLSVFYGGRQQPLRVESEGSKEVRAQNFFSRQDVKGFLKRSMSRDHHAID